MHFYVVLQDIFWKGNYTSNSDQKLMNNQPTLNAYNLLRKFPRLKADRNGIVTFNKLDLQFGFGNQNIALAFKLTSYLTSAVSDESDSSDLSASQIIHPDSLNIDFRDFCQALAICGRSDSHWKEKLLFLFILFADQLIAVDGAALPIISSTKFGTTKKNRGEKHRGFPSLIMKRNKGTGNSSSTSSSSFLPSVHTKLHGSSHSSSTVFPNPNDRTQGGGGGGGGGLDANNDSQQLPSNKSAVVRKETVDMGINSINIRRSESDKSSRSQSSSGAHTDMTACTDGSLNPNARNGKGKSSVGVARVGSRSVEDDSIRTAHGLGLSKDAFERLLQFLALAPFIRAALDNRLTRSYNSIFEGSVPSFASLSSANTAVHDTFDISDSTSKIKSLASQWSKFVRTEVVLEKILPPSLPQSPPASPRQKGLVVASSTTNNHIGTSTVANLNTTAFHMTESDWPIQLATFINFAGNSIAQNNSTSSSKPAPLVNSTQFSSRNELSNSEVIADFGVMTSFPSPPLNTAEALKYAFSDTALSGALSIFALTPSPKEEALAVQAALHQDSASSPRSARLVYVLDSKWWLSWCRYVNVSVRYDDRPAFQGMVRSIELLSASDLSAAAVVNQNTSSHSVSAPSSSSSVMLGRGQPRRRPNLISNTDIQIPYSSLLLPPEHLSGYDGSGNSLGDSYVILSPRAWNALVLFYSQPSRESPTMATLSRTINKPSYQSIAVPRRLCPPANKPPKNRKFVHQPAAVVAAAPLPQQAHDTSHWIELHPVEVHVHWYVSGGCASECPSDTVLVCGCCVPVGGNVTQPPRCNHIICTADNIVSRMLQKYSLENPSSNSLTTEDFRVWILINNHSNYITGSDVDEDSATSPTGSAFYVPVLPYVPTSSFSNRQVVATEGGSPKQQRPDLPSAGTRPGLTVDGLQKTFWKLLDVTDRQSPISSLINATGFGFPGGPHTCRIMIEGQQSDGKVWPLDRIFGAFGVNPIMFWTPETEDVVDDLPDHVQYRRGDELFARDAIGRWLVGEVVGFVALPKQKNTSGESNSSNQRSSREEQASIEICVQFRYAGYVWEEIVSFNSRIRRILPLNAAEVRAGAQATPAEVKAIASAENRKLEMTEVLANILSSTEVAAYDSLLSGLISSNAAMTSRQELKPHAPLQAKTTLPSGRRNKVAENPEVNDELVSHDGNSPNEAEECEKEVSGGFKQNLLQIKLLVLLSLDPGSAMRSEADSYFLNLGLNGSDVALTVNNDTAKSAEFGGMFSNGVSTSASVFGAIFSLPFSAVPRTNEAVEGNTQLPPTSNTKKNMMVKRPPMTVSTFESLDNIPSPGGAVGLNNLGNTCYMSSAIHCLSHTPLLASYFLSGKFKRDLNRTNVLGTGGRLTEEFAALLHLLWNIPSKGNTGFLNGNGNSTPSSQAAVKSTTQTLTNSSMHNPPVTRAVSAVDFKRTLQRCKSQFSGHDQQDAQEFLAELLDSLHEDLNRFDRARESIKEKRLLENRKNQNPDKSSNSNGHDVSELKKLNLSTSVESEKIDRDHENEIHGSAQSPAAVANHSVAIIESPRPSKASKKEQGREALSKHLARNKSVIMDLFLGQQCSEVTCRECGHTSLTFDPFMSLSLSLPKDQHEATVSVYFLRKMPRIRFAALDNGTTCKLKEGSPEYRHFIEVQSAVCRPIRLMVSLPRLSDIKDLKRKVCAMIATLQAEEISTWKKLGIREVSAEDTTAAELITRVVAVENGVASSSNSRYFLHDINRIVDDAEPLASLLEASDALLQQQNSTNSAVNLHRDYTLAIIENVKDVSFVTTMRSERLEDRAARPASVEPDKSPKSYIPSLNAYYDEDIEYNVPDALCGDVVVDIDETWKTGQEKRAKSWPRVITGIALGTRLDAVDHRGQWFPGSAMEWWQVETKDLEDIKAMAQDSRLPQTALVGMPREVGPHLRVHFDNFSHKWDEWFGPKDFGAGRLAPIYTNSQRKLKIFDVLVTHRRTFKSHSSSSLGSQSPLKSSSTQADSNRSLRSGVKTCYEVSGVPFTVQCESFRSCENFLSHVVEQAMRYASPAEWRVFLTALGAAREKCLSDTDVPFTWPREALPFVVRITNVGNALVIPVKETSGTDLQAKLGKVHSVWEGREFPKQFTKVRPFCNLYHPKLLVVIDWRSLHDSSSASSSSSSPIGKAFPSRARFVDLTFLDHESYLNYMKTQESAASIVSNGKSEYANPHVATVDHARDKRLGLPPAVALQECLRVYAGVEEHLEDNSWNCEVCCKASRGVMHTSLSRLPEILVVHLKRFGMTARWREKIRTRVIFPLVGLDMSPYITGINMQYFFAVKCCYCNSTLKCIFVLIVESLRPCVSAESRSEQSEVGALSELVDDSIYDLYAVVNHLGGMSGGHYTAFIKCATIAPTSTSAADSSSGATAQSAAVTGKASDDNSIFLDLPNYYKNPLDASRYLQYARCTDASDGGSWFLFDDDLVIPVPTLEVESHIVSG